MAAEKRQVSPRHLLKQSLELTFQEEEARIARKEASKGQPRAQSPEEDETPGIQSIHDATVTSRTKSKAAAPVVEEEEDVDIPELIDTSLTTLQEVLDKADVVVQVVDARDIAGGRSKFLEDLVQEAGGKIVLLVNKIGKLRLMCRQPKLTHRPCSQRDITVLAQDHLATNILVQVRLTRCSSIDLYATHRAHGCSWQDRAVGVPLKAQARREG
jgi:hypothetical protein